MMIKPTIAEIEAAASVPIHYFDTARSVTRTDVLSLADAEQVLVAVLPLVEARLREQIAVEIMAEYVEVAADEGVTLESDRIITAICSGMLRAHRIARGL